jgi:pilus assembly protein Flp/PilA
MQNAWFRMRDEESAQGLVEYALIIAIVSLGAVLALGFLSGRINNLFSKAGNAVNNVTTP